VRIDVSAFRIVWRNQPASSTPPLRSVHPRIRATLRGKKETWNPLSSSKPESRGAR
jgi:hypothetical protein